MPESLYTSAMTYENTFVEAIKWASVVFAAGFIGFFGKFLGKIVMARLHRGKGIEGGGQAPAPRIPPGGQTLSPEDKLRKKQAKNRLKRQKKLAKK